MHNKYGGIIWTNHALDRLRGRGIKQGDAWAVWRSPDSTKFSKKKNAWIYRRNVNDKTIEVIAKKNEKNEWLIISVWSGKSMNRGSGKNVSILNRLKKIFG